MNYLPPQRNYKQMVRIVREDNDTPLAKHSFNYQLGSPFGENANDGFDSLFANDGVSPTELQIRTLDTMNLPSSTARRPGKVGEGGILSNRSNSTLFHDLNDSTKNYINGMEGGNALSRHDMGTGTKFRTQLTPAADNKTVYDHGHFSDNASTSRGSHSSSQNTSHNALHPVESHFPEGYSKAKKHRSCSHSDLSVFD